MNRRAAEQLHRLGLDASPTTLVRDLRVAAQQQVEIAKALTLNARLLIFDEPTAALGGDETERLFEQIGRLKSEGVSFIYISHRLDEIARIADRVAVLRDGRLVAHHETAQVPVKALVEEMVGRPLDRMFPPISPPPPSEPLIEVEGLTSAEGRLRRHQLLGAAGRGVRRRRHRRRRAHRAHARDRRRRPDRGRLGQDQTDKPFDSTGRATRSTTGVVLVPEDRKAQGLILPQTIGENLALGNYRPRRAVRLGDQRADAGVRGDAASHGSSIKGTAEQRVNELSGGNQQKVVIAKSILREPKVVILDEPTRGIDVGARAAIYEIIADLARSGMAVIVVSSDLDEVLGLSHRVMVLSRGRNRGILDREAAGRVAVMELATT